MMSKEAMKLALEALESCGAGHISDGGNQWHDEKLVDKAITALREALAEQPAQPTTTENNGGKTGWPPGLLQDDCKGLSKWLSNKPDAKRRVREALDKMAENARELGLDYEPAQQKESMRPYRLLQDNGSKYFGESWDKAEQPAQTATYTCGVCGVSMQMEQPAQQEPVAWMNPNGGMLTANYIDNFASGLDKEIHSIPLYTSPPAQRTWVGLTDEEIKQAMDYWSSDEHSAYGGAASAAGEYFDVETSWRYIEAKLKEKNT